MFEKIPQQESIPPEKKENPFEKARYISIPPAIDPESGKYILYHGSANNNIDAFVTPTTKEIMDVTKGGVVYLVSDINKATKYAGKDGAVYEVLSSDPIPYHEQRQKQGLPDKSKEFLRNVFVALPGDTEIKQKISANKLVKPSRKTRKRQRFLKNTS